MKHRGADPQLGPDEDRDRRLNLGETTRHNWVDNAGGVWQVLTRSGLAAPHARADAVKAKVRVPGRVRCD